MDGKYSATLVISSSPFSTTSFYSSSPSTPFSSSQLPETKFTASTPTHSEMGDDQSIYFDIFNYTVSIVAILANCIGLAAVCNCNFRLSGYRLFLISLTSGDLYSAFINLVALVVKSNSLLNMSILATFPNFQFPFFLCGTNIIRALQLTGFFLSLLNLCGMNSDHLIGVLSPHKYQTVTSYNLTSFHYSLFNVS